MECVHDFKDGDVKIYHRPSVGLYDEVKMTTPVSGNMEREPSRTEQHQENMYIHCFMMNYEDADVSEGTLSPQSKEIVTRVRSIFENF